VARIDPKFGMLVPDSRFVPVNEEAVGITGISSAYTQAGPKPGTPQPTDQTSRWRPYMTGAQSSDIELITIQGGYAGVSGARTVYRLDGEGALARRGWDDANCLVQVTSPLTGSDWSTGSYANAAICTIPDTGLIVIVVTGASSGGEVYRYNPRSETWSSGYDFAANGFTIDDEQLALVWDDETNRLILFSGDGGPGDGTVRAYASDDYGSTWTLYSTGYYDTDQYDDGRMSVATGESAWVAFTGDDDVSQWESLDRGITWKQVNRITSFAAGQEFEVLALPSGGYLLIYIPNGGSNAHSRRLGYAGDNFGDAPAIDTGLAGTTIAACVDDDGAAYVYVQETGTGNLRCARSRDDGATWQPYQFRAIERPAGGSFGKGIWRGTTSCGQTHLVVVESSNLWDSSVAAPFALMTFGGWSNVEGGSFYAGYALDYARLGWGTITNAGGSTTLGACWIPASLPDAGVSPSWVKTGTGDVALTSGCYGEVTTSSGQLYYDFTWTATSTQAGHFHVQQVVGGSATTNDIAAIARAADGTYDYRASFRIASDSITVYDVHGTAGTTVSVDTTAGVYVRWMIGVATGGGSAWVSAWYRFAGATKWTSLVDADPLTEKGSARESTDGFAWGNISSGTATSRWSVVGVAGHGTWHYGQRTIAHLDAGFAHVLGEPIGLAWGHTVPARGTAAYPIPDATTTSENLGRIAASGGPSQIGDIVDLPTDYQYPARAVYCVDYPSPSKRWQSTDASEAKWVWDLGQSSWLGDAVGVAVLQSYARQWALEYSANGSSWTTVGTLDLAVGTSLAYTRVGNTILPRASTPNVLRYIAEGELIGGYAILSVTQTSNDVEDEFGVAVDATVTGTLANGANGLIGIDDSNYLTAPATSIGAAEYLHFFARVRRIDVASLTRTNTLIGRSNASAGGVEVTVRKVSTSYVIRGEVYDSSGVSLGARDMYDTAASPGDDIWLNIIVRENGASGIGAVRVRTYADNGSLLQDSITYNGTKPATGDLTSTLHLGRATGTGIDASEVEGDGFQWAVVRHSALLSDAEVAALITTGTPSAGTGVWYYRQLTLIFSTQAHRIQANSGGYWTFDNVQRCRIRLDGDTSATDNAGTCDIIAPSGVLVAYPSAAITPRYWRVRAAASQVTPGDVYRAGLIIPGRVVGLGADPGWDYSQRMELSRRVNRLQDGTPEIEELGPPRRVWSYGWTDGLVVRNLRGKANGGDWADYVATSAGLAIGTAEDPAYSLWGLLEHALESGSTPCVLLSSLPASTASITDPSLWHYGVLVSDSLGIVGVVGDEGVSEVVRLDSVTFESIR
jgi:hypothetical protein